MEVEPDRCSSAESSNDRSGTSPAAHTEDSTCSILNTTRQGLCHASHVFDDAWFGIAIVFGRSDIHLYEVGGNSLFRLCPGDHYVLAAPQVPRAVLGPSLSVEMARPHGGGGSMQSNRRHHRIRRCARSLALLPGARFRRISNSGRRRTRAVRCWSSTMMTTRKESRARRGVLLWKT
jgi:hypothetical protein